MQRLSVRRPFDAFFGQLTLKRATSVPTDIVVAPRLDIYNFEVAKIRYYTDLYPLRARTSALRALLLLLLITTLTAKASSMTKELSPLLTESSILQSATIAAVRRKGCEPFSVPLSNSDKIVLFCCSSNTMPLRAR